MIVRHFLQWIRTAPAGGRADATAALARAYLHSDLSQDDLAAAEGAMIMMLDDPSPMVRRALSEVLAASADAPVAIIHALAADQGDVAALVLARSPLLLDADLVDRVGAGDADAQTAIAGRDDVSGPVAAAIAEVGCAEACLVLIDNMSAQVPLFSFDRIVDRHGHLAAIRESLFERSDLPPATRQRLVLALSDTLARFVTARHWLDGSRAHTVARDACEKATVALAGETARAEVRPLVTHLRDSGQLTAGMMLRALLSGNVLLFQESLAELTEFPVTRIAGLLRDTGGKGLRALFDRAGLPDVLYPAVRAALDILRERGGPGEPGGTLRLKRHLVERVLARCERETDADIDPLLIVLRRFAIEAAREEARLFCDDLAA